MNAIIDEYAKNYVEKYVNEKLFILSHNDQQTVLMRLFIILVFFNGSVK